MGTRQGLSVKNARNVALVAASSPFALKVENIFSLSGFFHQRGIMPQTAEASSSSSVLGRILMIGAAWVGATLYRGENSGISSARNKLSWA